jgi:ADP-ribose pyrophosphatase
MADNWKELLAVYTSPGFSNERVVIFLAMDLSRTLDFPMDTEEITRLDIIPLGDVIDLIKENKIEDAKTVAGILAAKVFYEDETN